MSNLTANNDKKRNRILFDFESIIDLKLSYIRKYITESKGYPIQDFELYKYKFDRMYAYEDILKNISINEEDLLHPKYPVFTSMKSFINRINKDCVGLIYPTVLCKDGIQQRIIKETFPDIRIIVGSRNNVKTINFARIVLASPRHILEFRDPVTVDFMILNFRENFEKEDMTLIDPNILIKISDTNRITIAKAYTEIPDPVG